MQVNGDDIQGCSLPRIFIQFSRLNVVSLIYNNYRPLTVAYFYIGWDKGGVYASE